MSANELIDRILEGEPRVIAGAVLGFDRFPEPAWSALIMLGDNWKNYGQDCSKILDIIRHCLVAGLMDDHFEWPLFRLYQRILSSDLHQASLLREMMASAANRSDFNSDLEEWISRNKGLV
jgi:hypothetical protein